MKIYLEKSYKLRPRRESDARWFLFKPCAWIESQSAWRGKSATNHDLILFERELGHFDVIEVDSQDRPFCDCGAVKARSTHAHWCSLVIAES